MRAPHAIASGMVILSALAPASAQESAPTSAPAEPAVRPVTQARIMPPPPLWPEQTRRNSTGMMVTGIVLTSLGAVALPAGVAVIATDLSNGDDVAIAAVLVGFPLVIGSGVFAAVGIPLWVIGAREVPVRPGDEEARAVPEVFVGPTSASLRWTF